MTQGEVLRGNASNQYELLARLAQGGMAEIFLARANGLAGFERYVVLKRIRPERDDDPRWVTMFLDEARLAAQLQHPNIAQVFDLGQIGDSFFYTMEFVHGEDVLDVLSRTSALGQRMPLHISLAVAAGAATGLAYAHDRVGIDGQPLGIVHRDISPANLMISFDGTVKVLDFGVAKARNRDTKTEAGTIMGKVAYLSPEQCQTNQLDHRSDLFSLGIVLYEMVTHVRPFKRGTDYETLAAIVRFEPPPPSTVNPALPQGVDDLVMRCLAKDPRQRFSSAHELIEAIEAVADQAQASLAPRDLKRYMRDLYGTPPEPWRTIGGPEEVMGTFSGEVIGPLPTETRIKAFPADASADDVPLLPLARGVIGTPGAQHAHLDDLEDAALTPHVSYRPIPARLPTDDLLDASPTPINMQPIRVHPTIEAPPPIAPHRTTPPPARVSGRVSAQMPAHHSQSGRMPVQSTPPSGMPAQGPRSSGPIPAARLSDSMSGQMPAPMSGQMPAPMSGQMPAPMSGQMPAIAQSGPHNAPPGTIELIAPPSAIRALDTAPIRVVRPEDAREGRRNRSWLIIVVTVLAVVGVGIGAMAALGGKDETAKEPAATIAPKPSITPIEEPPTNPTNPAATNPTATNPPATSDTAGTTATGSTATTATGSTTPGTTGTATSTDTKSPTATTSTGTTVKTGTGSTQNTGTTSTTGTGAGTTSTTSTGTKSTTATSGTTVKTGTGSASTTTGAKSATGTKTTGTTGTGTKSTTGTTGTGTKSTSGTTGTKSKDKDKIKKPVCNDPLECM